MIETRRLSANALEIVVEGALRREDIPRVIDEVTAMMADGRTVDMFADVRGKPDLHFGLFVEEMKHLPALFGIMRKLERVALVADEDWLLTLARIEAKLMPGIIYKVYARADFDKAKAWLMREEPASSR